MIEDRTYQQCKRCVMDTSDPQIQFDENGYCNHCTGLLAFINQPRYKKEFNEQGFERLLKKIKKAGKNRRYDCVVGISGGVDSSYLAYLLKKKRFEDSPGTYGQWLEFGGVGTEY